VAAQGEERKREGVAAKGVERVGAAARWEKRGPARVGEGGLPSNGSRSTARTRSPIWAPDPSEKKCQKIYCFPEECLLKLQTPMPQNMKEKRKWNLTSFQKIGISQFTPFKLLFGDKAITPEEARTGSIRTLASAEDEEDCKITKDTIEGIRLQAKDHINKYQAETVKWHDRKVRLKNIKPGHLVLRRVANPDIVGKLQLKWEGPFLVVSSSRPRSYRLKDMDGNYIPRSWNADELRRYYV
jgi:hypothetical protein